MTDLHLDGARINGIGDLYDQLNQLLMAEEDWQLAPSLDALNDALYRVQSDKDRRARFVWSEHQHSRDALGLDTTRQWLQDKLARPEVFDQRRIQLEIDALAAGTGKTYFELVLDVFAEHPRVELVLA